MPQLIFYAEIDDHGISQGDTRQKLARWQRPVASRVALDLPYWAMCLAPYRLIRMAIEMACEAGPFFSVVNFLSCITVAKRPCYGLLKQKPSYKIVLYPILWWPADINACRFDYQCRWRASYYCNLQRGSSNIYFLL
jgi:hypothetical protein